MAEKCIDVSTHNGYIDFKKVKAAGIDNCIIRCGFTGYGSAQSLNKDDKFEINYKNAKEAGLRVGAYYYAVATSEADADREAAFVLSLLKDKQFELPVYYDVEDNHDVTAAGVHPQNMQNLGKAKLTAVVDRFCSTVEKAGYFTGFYTSTWWVNNLLDMSVLSRYTLWLAQWAAAVTYKGSYGIWQYSSTGSVDGITGNVDMNYVYQDFTTPIRRLGLNGFAAQTPEPPAEPEEPTVVMGDVNADGKVTEEDARLILRAAAGLEKFTPLQKEAADMDGDGRITAEDARLALRKSAGLES
ncbi:MAG: hypothetical protein IJO14_07930 [Clostridia bacterium]|nr:hypothetical protein [Clostridia bacterium]